MSAIPSKTKYNKPNPPLQQKEVVSATEIMRNLSFKTGTVDTPTSVQLPSVDLNPGECVEVIVNIINNTVVTPPEIPHSMNRKEDAKVRSDSISKSINVTLNTAILLFISSSVVFLLFAVAGVVLDKQDAIFGFLLCLISALMFFADKAYRRQINGR